MIFVTGCVSGSIGSNNPLTVIPVSKNKTTALLLCAADLMSSALLSQSALPPPHYRESRRPLWRRAFAKAWGSCQSPWRLLKSQPAKNTQNNHKINFKLNQCKHKHLHKPPPRKRNRKKDRKRKKEAKTLSSTLLFHIHPPHEEKEKDAESTRK